MTPRSREGSSTPTRIYILGPGADRAGHYSYAGNLILKSGPEPHGKECLY
jgi:hypothetical protein